MSPLTSFGRHDCFGHLCNLGLSKKLRFSLQRHNAPEFGKAEFWGRFAGFRFCIWTLLFYQQPCAKAKEFGEAEFWDCLPDFLWRNLVSALEKQGVCFLNQEIFMWKNSSYFFYRLKMSPLALLGRHDCFGCLCNQVLPKTLRFSLQRHKSCKKLRFLRYSAKQNSGIVCRFPLLRLVAPVLPTVFMPVRYGLL